MYKLKKITQGYEFSGMQHSAENKNNNKRKKFETENPIENFVVVRTNRCFSGKSSNYIISMVYSLWWIYCCCFICLLSNYNVSAVINGAYRTDTDDLINELDRPSKYKTSTAS